jgi:hypothetical protein
LRAEKGQRGENVSAVEVIRLFKRWDIKFRYSGHLYRIYLDDLDTAGWWTEYPTISRRSIVGIVNPALQEEEVRHQNVDLWRKAIEAIDISHGNVNIIAGEVGAFKITPGSMQSGWINFKTFCWYSQPLAPI